MSYLNQIKFNYSKSVISDNKNNDLFIYAHKNETLYDHINKTLYIFNILVDNEVLLNFYKYFYENNYIDISFSKFKIIINNYIIFHDIGKISINFQINRLNKNNSKIRNIQEKAIEKINLKGLCPCFDLDHSLAGAIVFILVYQNIFNNNKLFLLILSYSIYEHHSYLKDISNLNFFKNNISFSPEKLRNGLLISLFLDINRCEDLNKINTDFFHEIQKTSVKEINTLKIDSDILNQYYFSFFYNYIYSLLISSDVWATKYYSKDYSYFLKMENKKFDNRIDMELESKMTNSFYSVSYNSSLNEKFLDNISNIHNINSLRKNMLLEASFNLKRNIENKSNRVFFLNMPTGAGKTNTSMKLALDLIENTSADRIIYAMPFINIIEQNYDIIKDNFGLNEELGEIRKIYSATETIFDETEDNVEEINDFKSRIILSDSFFNYPVIFTTFVTFFDSILKNSKKNKYKISSLVNSLVILDEIQSLPLKNWNSLYYLINGMAETYNIHFIVMSATLPKFDKLKISKDDKHQHKKAISLINSPEKYFNHYLFHRTEVKGGIVELSLDDVERIKEYFLEVIYNNFNNDYNKGLIVLNTIKSSKIIYNILNEYSNDFEIDLLNSSLLYNVKKEIIYKINNMKKDRTKKYILVSTQSIEAGVDVSFDFVIRDFAILDSIEQVRGRCNRSRELNDIDPYKKGNIYLINLKDNKNYIHSYIYNKEEMNSRILETKKLLTNNINYNYQNILDYYKNISININSIDDINEKDRFTDRDNINNWNKMEYSKLQDKNDGIHIIDNQLNQYSIFIPISIYIFTQNYDNYINFEKNIGNIEKLFYNDKDKFIFSLNELNFIKKIQENNSEYKFINRNCIDGNQFISFYKNYINNFDKSNFDSYKIIIKEFSSIINKFIINITLNDKNIEDKINDEYDNDFEKYSYFYIMDKKLIGDDEDSLYSINKGLNYNYSITEIL